jgi:hypothetical protein
MFATDMRHAVFLWQAQSEDLMDRFSFLEREGKPSKGEDWVVHSIWR